MPNSKNIVIFDLDNTITNCDTYVAFLIFVLMKKPLRIIRASWLPIAVITHKLKLKDNSWLKEVFLSSIASGLTKSQIEQLSHEFATKIVTNNIYKDARKQITEHIEKGDTLFIASASFDFYVEKIAKQLGFHEVICTQSSWDSNNRLTGKINGKNCYGKNKVHAVKKFITSNNTSYSKTTCYTDHHSDIELLDWATHGIAINPTKKLLHKIKNRKIATRKWQ